MISFKHKCIFIEVPKTGSTSIRDIIGFPTKPHLDILEIKAKLVEKAFDDAIENKFGKAVVSKIIVRLTPQFIKTNYGNKIYNNFYKFGFVRNPWSRVVSLYQRKEGVQKKDEMTFEEFVSWIQMSSDTSIHPSPKKNQLDWFTDKKNEILVDYIGKFETLSEDWSKIAKELNVQDELPHKNKNAKKKKHYTEYYTEETKEIIREKFKVDIEYFNYEFEN